MEPWEAKVAALAILIVISWVFGVIPIPLVRRLWRTNNIRSGRGQRILSFLNCFSGGVFLGTSFLHLIPEVSDSITKVFDQKGLTGNYPVSEIIFCGGFFLLMVFEHVVLSLNKRHEERRPPVGNVTAASNITHSTDSFQTYGSTRDSAPNNEARPLLAENRHYTSDIQDSLSQQQSLTHDHDAECQEQPPHHHHGDSHRETAELHGIRSFVLYMALSLHTIFEGLALGLQENTADVWTLFAALVVHKALIAFTLGLQFTENVTSKRKVLIFMSIFSIMAPLGVAMGTGLMAKQSPSLALDMTSAVLQGVATGTFLYVTFFEVLQTEVGNDQDVVKVLFVLFGFACIALLKLADVDRSDSHSGSETTTALPNVTATFQTSGMST